MKTYKSIISLKCLQNLFAVSLTVCPLLLVSQTNAGQITSYTNQDDLFFEFVIPKTNWVVGEQIMASMVVSNMSSVTRMIPWAFGDACTTGFGEYLIVDGKTGRRLDCIVPLANRTSIGPSSLGHFGKNDSKCFESDLTSVYGITNSGIYWIQAVGRFSYIESPSKQFTISTPPVIIFISRNVDTNAPPK